MKTFKDRLTVLLMGALYFSTLRFVWSFVVQQLEVVPEGAWYQLSALGQGGVTLLSYFVGFLAALYLIAEFISPRIVAASCDTIMDRVKFLATAAIFGILTPCVLFILVPCFLLSFLIVCGISTVKACSELAGNLSRKRRQKATLE